METEILMAVLWRTLLSAVVGIIIYRVIFKRGA